MNRLNRKVEYALMALKYMARKPAGTLTSAKEISDSLHLPFDATARVLQVMGQRNWLHVEQGTLGGYGIGRPLEELSLYDLVAAIEGPVDIARCIHGEGCDLLSSCNIHSPITELNKKVEKFYQGLVLSEILAVTS